MEAAASIMLRWRLAGQQIYQLERLVRSDPEQRRRVLELKALFMQRGEQFALPRDYIHRPPARFEVARATTIDLAHRPNGSGTKDELGIAGKVIGRFARRRELLRRSTWSRRDSSRPNLTALPII